MREIKLIILFSLITVTVFASGQLQKVLILSRHGLRTPLTSSLKIMTPKEWPEWTEDVAHLTKKGAILESFMAKYISEWLNKEGLITTCPTEEKVSIFANTKPRTKATAEVFAKAAFPNCNVKFHAKNSTEMDPVFNPIVRNDSKIYTDSIKQEMIKKINELDVKAIYKMLNNITDIKNSAICREDSYCDLSKDNDEVIFEMGKEPNMTGPLFIGCAIVDSFLMSYYEGKDKKDIAWGQIENNQKWEILTKILIHNLNVRFNISVAKDICSPLLNYMKEKLLKNEELFTLLIGHDSNLVCVLRALNFESFELPGQLEYIPIGGKIVFQKWRVNGEDYLKVEYVYQSVDQIVNAEPISMANPPKNVTLSLKYCKVNKDKLCKWQDFLNILNDVTY